MSAERGGDCGKNKDLSRKFTLKTMSQKKIWARIHFNCLIHAMAHLEAIPIQKSFHFQLPEL